MRNPRNARNILFASVLAAIGTLSGELAAQGTSSGIRGRLVDGSGSPLANATVVVQDSRTGATRTLESNNTGTFYATNLTLGTPIPQTQRTLKIGYSTDSDTLSASSRKSSNRFQ